MLGPDPLDSFSGPGVLLVASRGLYGKAALDAPDSSRSVRPGSRPQKHQRRVLQLRLSEGL